MRLCLGSDGPIRHHGGKPLDKPRRDGGGASGYSFAAWGRAPRELWIRRVERWRDSGLSAKEFAEQAGVDSDRLRHWKWRLAQECAEPKTVSAAVTG
jgi:hypothetical protein